MGNLDSKLSPYYEIVDELNTSFSTSGTFSSNPNANDDKNNPQCCFSYNNSIKFNPNNLSIWSIKRANVNNNQNKNAILFELINKNSTKNQIQLALNQLKIIKKIRHPNIVRYLYSEEHITANLNQSKLILITEFIRPLNDSLRLTLSKEQIIRGLYSITNALCFLHEKLAVSHNNLNQSTIYLNSKQIWKLNDFELSIGFSDLSKASLRQIYAFKDKACIAPEEELAYLESNDDNSTATQFDSVINKCPHSLDAYAWAMLVISLLSNKKKQLDSDDDASMLDLEIYLSKEPIKRPILSHALNLNLFDLYQSVNTADSSKSMSYYLNGGSKRISNEESQSSNHSSQDSQQFDPFRLASLKELEASLGKLVSYLNDLISTGATLNEKLIDFLLSPLMFFSDQIRQQIFPGVFIPKEEYEKKSSSMMIHYHNLNLLNANGGESIKLRPFIDLDKYRAFVLPRILNLFSMRSTQIRLVLLEYFPFYINYVNDLDTLKDEILPELLVGLKENNNTMVSLTFSCLSMMVQLIGCELVVGKSTEKSSKLFSDNIPKTLIYNLSTKAAAEEFNNKKPTVSAKISSMTASLEEEDMINWVSKNEEEHMSKKKTFSDSMIGLHDDGEQDNDGSSIHVINPNNKKSNGSMPMHEVNDNEAYLDDPEADDDDDDDDDDWSNDFGWSGKQQQEETAALNENAIKSNGFVANDASDSLLSLVDSIEEKNRHMLMATQQKILSLASESGRGASVFRKNDSVDFGFDYDIKSIRIEKKLVLKDEKELLIDSFLNEMIPVINMNSNSSITAINNKFQAKSIANEEVNSFEMQSLNGSICRNGSQNDKNLWECGEIDLE